MQWCQYIEYHTIHTYLDLDLAVQQYRTRSRSLVRYRETSIYLQYTVLPVHIDIDLYSTIGHVYGDYELTCGVTSMRPSSMQQDLSLQSLSSYSIASRRPQAEDDGHLPPPTTTLPAFQRDKFCPTLPNLGKPKSFFPFSFSFFLSFFLPNNLHRFNYLGQLLTIQLRVVAIAQRSAKALMSRRQIVHVHIGEHIYGVDIKTP